MVCEAIISQLRDSSSITECQVGQERKTLCNYHNLPPTVLMSQGHRRVGRRRWRQHGGVCCRRAQPHQRLYRVILYIIVEHPVSAGTSPPNAGVSEFKMETTQAEARKVKKNSDVRKEQNRIASRAYRELARTLKAMTGLT